MTAEWGHFALILSFFLGLGIISLPIWGVSLGLARQVGFAEKASIAQFFLVSLAFVLLMKGFLVSDFSLKQVAAHSHSLKPVFYKLAASWGHHEGSLLLWVWVLVASGAFLSRARPEGMGDKFRRAMLMVQAGIGTSFLVFMILASNPFERLFPVPPEGRGLNPLLQDPGLVFHPPLLYIGYVGLSIGFSFAAALLLDHKSGAQAVRWMRPWILAAWLFLTAGITAGSWWAYRELGWGGFWFWDPVENLSLIPWLIATALLHSVMVTETRKALLRWTLLLAIFGFSASLLGTFFVRSGLLTSVHSFSSDPARGVFILAITGLLTGGALGLFAFRAHHVQEGSVFRPASREAVLVFNNMVLCSAAATVFLATIYPVILEALGRASISVGAPYYVVAFLPLVGLLLLMMGPGPLLPWRGIPSKQGALLMAKKWLGLFLLLLALFAGMAFFLPVFVALGFAAGLWLLGCLFFANRFSFKQMSLSHYAMHFGHAGIAILVLGITGATLLSQEKTLALKPGESTSLGPVQVQFMAIKNHEGPNYQAKIGTFKLSFSGGGKAVWLYPERRAYVASGIQTTEAAIHRRYMSNIYIAIGEAETAGGALAVRIYSKPLILLIWLGGFLMVAGGILGLFRPGRTRVKK